MALPAGRPRVGRPAGNVAASRTDMQKITNWSAARSGASITVTGKDEAGEAFKVAGVHTIEPKDGAIVATDLNGTAFLLALEPAELPASPVPADDLSMGNG